MLGVNLSSLSHARTNFNQKSSLVTNKGAEAVGAIVERKNMFSNKHIRLCVSLGVCLWIR